MQSKTLYLHVGHYKTGSSAIQKFLSENQEELKRFNVLYPSRGRPATSRTSHAHLSMSIAREHGFVPPAWYGADITSDEAFDAVIDEIQMSREEKIVISSEEFVQLALRSDPISAVTDLFERFSGFDVKIVFFCREPLSLLKSWYGQVNKGPFGTRNFPTFFMNLRYEFLSQYEILKAFSDIFGSENILSLPYRSVGSSHIKNFLSTLDCDMPVPPENVLINESVPASALELNRLSKERKHSYHDATVTGFRDVNKFVAKVERVNEGYCRLSEFVSDIFPSKLSPSEIISYYRDLSVSLSVSEQLNPAEADRMRDLALQAEDFDLGLARELMLAARMVRTNGPMINKKLEEYRVALGS